MFHVVVFFFFFLSLSLFVSILKLSQRNFSFVVSISVDGLSRTTGLRSGYLSRYYIYKYKYTKNKGHAETLNRRSLNRSTIEHSHFVFFSFFFFFNLLSFCCTWLSFYPRSRKPLDRPVVCVCVCEEFERFFSHVRSGKVYFRCQPRDHGTRCSIERTARKRKSVCRTSESSASKTVCDPREVSRIFFSLFFFRLLYLKKNISSRDASEEARIVLPKFEKCRIVEPSSHPKCYQLFFSIFLFFFFFFINTYV